MTIRPSHASPCLVGASVAFALLAVVPQARLAAYVPAQPAGDTLRARSVASHPHRMAGEAGATMVVRGYWSSCGLPPVAGQFTLSDTGLMLQSSSEQRDAALAWQPSTISLAYVDEDGSGIHYVFHLDGGVFETDVPGPLLQLANRALIAERSGTARPFGRTLVDAADPVALREKADEIAQSSYADSLYRLFGRPRAGIGVIGARGRRAGRLGEYMAARDSLALDPGHMIGEDQLRHALAHELGHRWQARGGKQVARLWAGVPPIKDPKRYGYDDLSEHQAEAIAFAINFLQTTARGTSTEADAVTLLEHYELLVPGTRVMVRYLSQQPLYRYHPLRLLLNTGLSRS